MPLGSTTARTLAMWTLLAIGLFLPSGCDGDGQVAEGERVYNRRLSEGNEMTCATCHALEEPATDGFRHVAHSLRDAAHRPSYKGGAFTDLRDAANTCVRDWMAGVALGAFDPRWEALSAFLEAQADASGVGAGEAPALVIEIVPPPADLSGGDAALGEALFEGSCARCHGEGGAGTLLAPTLRGSELDESLIARRARLGGDPDSPVYEGLLGGEMPFWAADRLSDEELRDVIAFLLTISVRPVEEDAGLPPDAGVPSDAGP